MTFAGTLSAINAALDGLTFTPAANSDGSASIAITTLEQTGQAGDQYDSDSVAITVLPVNDAPAAVSDSYTATAGQTLTVSAPDVLANDTDVDSPSLTAVKITDPARGSLTLDPNGSFSYTPTAGFAGADSFTYTAKDSGNAASNTVTVTTTVGNVAPVAGDDSYVATAGTTLTADAAQGVLANDVDPDSPTLTAIKVTDPARGSLTLNPNGSLTSTPAPGYTGPDSFSYRASDGIAQSPVATVRILVVPATLPPVATNVAPVAGNDSFVVVAGAALTVNAPGVLGNDVDPDSPSLTAVKLTDPARGSLVLRPDGGFIYTPNADFFGTDSFTYRANDGATQSNIATVTIGVMPTACGPRPRVQTTLVAGGGKLHVHVETAATPTQQNNPLKQVRFGTLQNATVTLNGQVVSSDQTITVPAPANARGVDFTVERVTPGQPVMVPFVVVDDCGEWPSFVGGGTGASF